MVKEIDNELADVKYLRAKKRVEQLKGYYSHLVVYIVVNLFISIAKIVGDMTDGFSFEDAVLGNSYSLWFWWGIGIAFHTYKVFGARLMFMGKDWEDKKIKEYMNEK